MMNSPHGLLDDLGEVAARFNRGAAHHGAGCCLVCRRALVGIIQALMDPANWAPENPEARLEKLQAEIDMLKEAQRPAPAQQPEMAPDIGQHEQVQFRNFPPPFTGES